MFTNLLKGSCVDLDLRLVFPPIRNHGSEVMTFLRNVQQLTRFLQRTCVHAKKHREARLTSLIPQTRKCLESFVYAVKASFLYPYLQKSSRQSEN